MNCSECGLYNDPDAPGIMNFPDGTQLVKCEHCDHLRFNNDNKQLIFFGNEFTIWQPSIFNIKWKIKERRKKKQRMKYYLETLGVKQ